MKTSTDRNELLKKAGAVLLALLVWQLAALAVGYDFILASPLLVLKAFARLLPSPAFWTAVGISLEHIFLGFIAAFALGGSLAWLANRFGLVRTLLWPFMLTVRTVPVASFVILALFWMSSGKLPVFVSFLAVLPIVYMNVLTGLKGVPKEYLEVADIFGASGSEKLRMVYLPLSAPSILNAASLGIGVAWKSGVAAEVIALASGSVGEKLYMSKVYFAMDELFAWTITVIVLSALFDKAFGLLLRAAIGTPED